MAVRCVRYGENSIKWKSRMTLSEQSDWVNKTNSFKKAADFDECYYLNK